MSKPIKLTNDIFEDARKEFEEQLKSQSLKLFDGKVSFSKTYKWKNDEKATIIFTPEAYIKMLRLIQEFSSEVAWHGIARRDENDAAVFHITDILVYPQTVTGSTVNTDQNKYQDWLMALDDENFNNLRMQGHSHVNMAPSPSGVDTTHQEAILNQLEDTMFYIFMIWNKSLAHNIKIFDLANNTLYEDSDVEVKVHSDEQDFDKFITESKELVVAKTTTYGGSYGGGYKGSSNTTSQHYNWGGNQKKEEKKETKETKDGIGNGWNNRGYSAMEEYYDDIGGYHYY